MDGPAIVNDLDDYLDVLGQQPLLKIYTQICFCSSVADASSHSAIVNTLTTGLERLSASFPWIAGKVVNEGSDEGNTGIFKIKPLEKIPRLVVKDLRHDPSIPTMDALRRANFPISMLDENIIAPRKTLPGSSDESASEVFLVQANFITGGLLLTFVGQHQTMDMTGQSQIIDLFSKACHNEQFTSEELSSGNLARHNLIPLLDDSYRPGSELARQIVKPTPSHRNPAPPPSPKCTWAYFTFPHLAHRSEITRHKNHHPPLRLHLHRRRPQRLYMAIRHPRSPPRLSPTAESTFARAVDVRRYLDIPQTYPGLVQNMAYHTYTLQKLVEEPLGGIASQLRSALDPKTSNLGHHTRALATFLNRSPDKNVISFTATLDLSADIMLSSWAKLDCYELDFNLGLAKPEAVRRPRFDPVESLIYLMPRTLDGEIAVAICLRDEDMERLRADEEFAKYARYVG
ncbi:O-acetyltransferase dmxR13 [Coniosporium tulheliwenetii]|uniref:O-acetyltransferase dmxR13 n=1 Tax=Coniosporium tulheliwenetii TaxID=3383036 RepID=A0ACC2Z3C7_9PEZI|nr:O-acetyltransferase dmxR13 [Cladosporium sp. JES 115]